MKPADIKRVAEAAKGHGEAILARWLPGGKVDVSGEYWVLNPRRADKTIGSFHVTVSTGKGFDHSSKDGFGDYVGMVSFVQSCSQSDAADALTDFLRIQAPSVGPTSTSPAKQEDSKREGWRVLSPVPDNAQPPPVAHWKKGKPDHIFAYRNEKGQLLGLVYRWDATKTEVKKFCQVTYQEHTSGRRQWQWWSWPIPRPLFGLNLLAERIDAVVWILDGELKTEAARTLLPDAVCICYSHGGKSAKYCDYGPLDGRDVIIWPDNDKAGTEDSIKVAELAKKSSAKRVRFLNLGLFAKHTIGAKGQIIDRIAPLPNTWDASDARAEGWTQDSIAAVLARDDALIDDLVPTIAEDAEVAQPETEVRQANGPYLLDDDLGLFCIENGKDNKVYQTRICAPVKVPALARDAEGGAWSPVIEFRDRDGQQRREVIPFRQFVGDGHDGVKQLADIGLEIVSGRQALDRLKAYILGAQPDRRARLVDQTGWNGRAFLLPEGGIGETDETLLFRGNRRALNVYATKGSLTDWQSYIAHPARENPRLMFTLCAGFAGPFLKILGMQGAAFHFVGDSSTGKSGALAAAGSIWGSTEAQVHSWRSTSNALEYVAAQHNDALLILDELREVDPKEAGAITYMLSNAKGKGRAHHAGGLRESTVWRIVMLSSGELGLSDHLASAGQRHFAGQEVRFIEIESDAGAGLGMWNVVIRDGKTFTDNLKKFANRHYGTAGRVFLAELVKCIDSVPSWWRHHETEFAKEYKPEEAGGQVLRVMSAFCLVAFAGEVASKFEIVPWQRGSATRAAGLLFEEWAAARPSKGNSEEAKIIAHVRAVMEKNWQSRFIDWGRAAGTRRLHDRDERGDFDPDISRMSPVHDSLGFRKADIPFDQDNPHYLFYVTRARFAEEFGNKGGFKPKRVAAVLKKLGALRCDQDGTTLRETLPNGDPRSYCIVGSKLWALDI
jgi:uncharacterized protein (DUF927 family)